MLVRRPLIGDTRVVEGGTAQRSPFRVDAALVIVGLGMPSLLVVPHDRETEVRSLTACSDDLSTIGLDGGAGCVQMCGAHGSEVVPLVEVHPNAVVLLDDNGAGVGPLARRWRRFGNGVGGGSNNVNRVDADGAAPCVEDPGVAATVDALGRHAEDMVSASVERRAGNGLTWAGPKPVALRVIVNIEAHEDV